MNKVINDLFTGPDGKSIEIAHVIWALGVLAVIGIAVYTAVKTGTYPPTFGQDLGLVSAGGGVGAYARAKSDQTQPPGDNP